MIRTDFHESGVCVIAPESARLTAAVAGTSTLTRPVQSSATPRGNRVRTVPAARPARSAQDRADCPEPATTLISPSRTAVTGPSHQSGCGSTSAGPSKVPASRAAPSSATKVSQTRYSASPSSPRCRVRTTTRCTQASAPRTPVRSAASGRSPADACSSLPAGHGSRSTPSGSSGTDPPAGWAPRSPRRHATVGRP